MPRQYRIGVLIAKGSPYLQQVVIGISRAIRARKSWSVRLAGVMGGRIPSMLDWRPDGVIADVTPANAAFDTLHSLDIPVVNVTGVAPAEYGPTVRFEDREVGAVAAHYLLNRNLKHFAFWSDHHQPNAERRRKGFFAALRKRGVTASHLNALPPFDTSDWQARDRVIREWMTRLPKPVGLLAGHDMDAYYLCGICRDAGLDVPNKIALLGVDDDRMICGLADPPLSSVQLAFQRIGMTAVEILADILEGRGAPRKPVLIPPLGVVSRGSTDMLAADDPDAVAAARYIRAHAAEGITVPDVLAAVPLTRRSLERRFKAAFDRSPAAEIRRVRLERAKYLLLSSESGISEIARMSGFNSAEYFADVFRREVGMPPSHYRRRPHQR